MSELMSEMRSALRARHYGRRTEQAYCLWVRRFIRFHGLRHPVGLGEPEINAFLTHRATRRWRCSRISTETSDSWPGSCTAPVSA